MVLFSSFAQSSAGSDFCMVSFTKPYRGGEYQISTREMVTKISTAL